MRVTSDWCWNELTASHYRLFLKIILNTQHTIQRSSNTAKRATKTLNVAMCVASSTRIGRPSGGTPSIIEIDLLHTIVIFYGFDTLVCTWPQCRFILIIDIENCVVPHSRFLNQSNSMLLQCTSYTNVHVYQQWWVHVTYSNLLIRYCTTRATVPLRPPVSSKETIPYMNCEINMTVFIRPQCGIDSR